MSSNITYNQALNILAEMQRNGELRPDEFAALRNATIGIFGREGYQADNPDMMGRAAAAIPKIKNPEFQALLSRLLTPEEWQEAQNKYKEQAKYISDLKQRVEENKSQIVSLRSQGNNAAADELFNKTAQMENELNLLAPMNQSVYQANQPVQGNFGYAVLGFFIPIVGLILFCVWNSSTPNRGNGLSAGKGALTSVIVGVLIYIIVLVVACSAANSLSSY
jgi:hypothetical protein